MHGYLQTVLAVDHSLLSTGVKVAGVGIVGALIMLFLGSKRIEPQRSNPYGRGKWSGARILRIPFIVLGVAGLVMMLIAVL